MRTVTADGWNHVAYSRDDAPRRGYTSLATTFRRASSRLVIRLGRAAIAGAARLTPLRHTPSWPLMCS